MFDREELAHSKSVNLPPKFPNLFPKDLPKRINRSKLIYDSGKWREILPNL